MDDKAGRPPAGAGHAAYSCYLEAEGYEFAIRAYLIPLILVMVVGQSLVSLARGADIASRLRDREAFASVALGWIPVVLLGALPYWLGGVFYGPAELSMDSVAVTDVMSGAIHSVRIYVWLYDDRFDSD